MHFPQMSNQIGCKLEKHAKHGIDTKHEDSL